MVTANISIEYFTIGHPKIIKSESPFQLALSWGVIATWWVGLILGILISFTARFGKHPKADLENVFRLMLQLVLAMGIIAIIAGLIGYITARFNLIFLNDRVAAQIEKERHHLFLIAGWSHSASYLTGFIGGIVVCIKIWKKRKLSEPV